jgi:hypothetical protein
MQDVKYITLSKLDVAKRQLEHSIKLFFRSGDPIVIHSLSSAAYQVLRDLAKKQKIKSVIYDELMSVVKPERKEMIARILSEAKNYFKHADTDSEEPHKFYYKNTEVIIWDACVIYKRLTNEDVPIFTLFIMWFYMDKPQIIKSTELKDNVLKILKNFDTKNKSQFLDLLPDLESKLLK